MPPFLSQTRREEMMNSNKPYKRFAAWQSAHAFALKVYEVTKRFPREELYGITSQLRRASLSVPTNIVEGTARQGQRELKNFLNIALGSLVESEYLLEFCREIGYLTKEDYEELESLRSRTGLPLWNFYRSL
jgi:four helix bundle protein